MKKKFLLHPFGSAGDVYPFVGLGQALKARGHDVTVLTSGYFANVVAAAGLDFVDTLPADQFLQLVDNPNLWSKIRGPAAILKSMTPALLENCYSEIENRFEAGNTVLLAPCIGFPARLASEKLGVPLITVALQPALLWSEYEAPALDGIWHSGPKWFKRFQYNLAERLFIDRHILPTYNGLRAKLGLPPIKGITKHWLSPDGVLCLFPEWLAPRQPDWPQTIQFSQFPLWNESMDVALSDELSDFLAAGDKPIVFAPGSANKFADHFFQSAATACKRMRKRGILFSKFSGQIPTALPADVKHFSFAPFQKLLPRCAAIAHHGGVGTMANAMSAGIPQLIMPMTYDQPDNARRIRRLGNGDFLTQRQFTPNNVESKLQRLLSDAAVLRSCKTIATRVNSVDPFERACEFAESFVD